MTIQWSLVLFTVLTGAAGWMFTCATVDKLLGRNADKLFGASIVAICVMAVGGIASVTHLAHPENILSALNHPTSGIFAEAVLCGLAIVAMAVFAILVKRGAAEGAQKAFAVIGAALGIILSFVAGNSYIMSAVSTWNTVLLPIGYLCTSIPVGAALYLCMVARDATTPEDVQVSAWLLIAGGILAAIASIAYVAAAGALSSLGVIACVACVLAGGAVPAVCGYLTLKKPEKAFTMAILALCGALVGSIAFRCIMWMAFSLAAIGAPYITDFGTL